MDENGFGQRRRMKTIDQGFADRAPAKCFERASRPRYLPSAGSFGISSGRFGPQTRLK